MNDLLKIFLASYLCSLYFQLLLMGKSRPGCMTTWAPGSIMMLLGIGAPQCFIVPMEIGNTMKNNIEGLPSYLYIYFPSSFELPSLEIARGNFFLLFQIVFLWDK